MFLISRLGALISCSLFPIIFVGSLYIWKQDSKLDRNHPKVIKQRFISVLITCILSTIYLYLFWESKNNSNVSDFFEKMGLLPPKYNNTRLLLSFFLASILPLLLTMILFLGPLLFIYFEPSYVDPIINIYNIIWWRNIIIAPISEEYVFRSCMIPLLIDGGFSTEECMIISPIFFGMAHLHHIIQHLHKQGRDLKKAWLEVLFQMFYTTIFGCYSSFLFVRTGFIIIMYYNSISSKRTTNCSFIITLFLQLYGFSKNRHRL
jgi:prenyl protein peptidase